MVADEVRKLAEKVKTATDEINSNISTMTTLVTHTDEGGAQEIEKYAGNIQGVVDDATGKFKNMMKALDDNNSNLLQISSALEELSVTNSEIHEKVDAIHELSGNVQDKMADSTESSVSLRNTSEGLLEQVAQFKTGESNLETILHKAFVFVDEISIDMVQIAKKT